MYTRTLLTRALTQGRTKGVAASPSCSLSCRRVLAAFSSKATNEDDNNLPWAGLTSVGVVALGLAATYHRIGDSQHQHSVAHAEAEKKLPEYSREEVSKHKTKETGIWVTYQGKVYDVTEFAQGHPGGSKILLAAGGSVEPFWNLYAVHKNNKEVMEILHELEIGTMKPGEEEEKVDANDPYGNEPKRHPVFKINTLKPFNAEPPGELLVDSFITPNDLYFKRNHLPVPDIKGEDYALEVEVEGVTSMKLTLEELKTLFPHYSVTTTMQCAGNRRTLIHDIKPVKGLSWTGYAISNATWTGVRLRDVLLWAGVKNDCEGQGLNHVHFLGLDRDITGTTYSASIPIQKAIDPRGDCLLAFEMNGVPIPRDHGYPVRAVAPGIVGARNVKWVGKVKASKGENDGFWQQKDYKNFNPQTDWDTVDFTSAPAIQDMPIQSAIGAVENLEYGAPVIKGYAYSGGGRGIVRVDISIDGGKNWQIAKITHGRYKEGDYYRNWTWALWEYEVPQELLQGKKEIEVVVKATDTSYNVQPEIMVPYWNLRGATDTSYNVQPEVMAPYWNLRGVLANCWPRLKLQLPTAGKQEEEGADKAEAEAA